MSKKEPEVVDKITGEVLDPDFVAYTYTREGRRVVGHEFPNPVPLEPPLGHIESVPIQDQIYAMVQRHLAAAAEREEFETEEEANDFDVGDDFDPMSPWEVDFEPTEPWPPREIVEALTGAQKAGGDGGQSPPSESPAPLQSQPAATTTKPAGE